MEYSSSLNPITYERFNLTIKLTITYIFTLFLIGHSGTKRQAGCSREQCGGSRRWWCGHTKWQSRGTRQRYRCTRMRHPSRVLHCTATGLLHMVHNENKTQCDVNDTRTLRLQVAGLAMLSGLASLSCLIFLGQGQDRPFSALGDVNLGGGNYFILDQCLCVSPPVTRTTQ